jgi:hypothetical protein
MPMIFGKRFSAVLINGGRVAIHERGATEQRLMLIGVQARELWSELARKRSAAVDDIIRPYLRAAPPGRDGCG